jgi:hypothetical protein
VGGAADKGAWFVVGEGVEIVDRRVRRRGGR